MATSDNPFLMAADTANMQAGASESLLDNLGNYTGAALVSGLASIYNTGAELINKLGGEAEKIDVMKVLNENDADMGAYYAKNREAVDVGGFIATSLIPGGLALKGLQLAKAGSFGGAFARTAGYFSDQRAKYLDLAIKDLAVSGGTIFSQINRNKLLSMAWGTADNVVQVAAFETAVAATMKQSPLLEKDDMLDLTSNILKTSFAFGLLGGTLEALAIHSAYKGASKYIDSAINKYRALEITTDALDMSAGNKAYLLLQSMLELPKEGYNLEYLHRLLPKGEASLLPTKEAFERAAAATTKRGWDEFRFIAAKMSPADDPKVGEVFAHAIEKQVLELQTAGKSTEEILEQLQGYLQGVSKIRRIPEDAAKGTKQLFYVAEQLPVEAAITIKTSDDLLRFVASRTPTPYHSKNPFELVGDINQIKLARQSIDAAPIEGGLPVFAVAKDAFDDGYDAVIRSNGTIAVNPKSKNIVAADDPLNRPRQYFNIATGSFSHVAYPTVADLATTAHPVAVVGAKNTVTAGFLEAKAMKLFDDFEIAKLSSIDASARYAWLAAQTEKGSYVFATIPGRISGTDIPMLERIFQEGANKWQETRMVFADKSEVRVGDITNFGDWLRNHKLQLLQNHLARNGPEDLMSLGVKFNVDPYWIQNAIANNFVATEQLAKGYSIPLRRSLYPANIEVIWDFSQNIQISKDLTKGSTVPTLLGGKKVVLPDDADHLLVQHLPDGAGNSIYGMIGIQHNLRIARDQNEAAVFQVLGADKAGKLVSINADSVRRIADARGAGPTLVGSSNADYGDPIRSTFQYSGQLAHVWIQERANATLTKFQPIAIRINNSKEASAELGILTTAVRRESDQFVLHPNNPRALINAKAVGTGERGEKIVLEEKLRELEAQKVTSVFHLTNDDVVAWVHSYLDTNRSWVEQNKVLLAARGHNLNWNPDVFHVPPVDTSRFPFFALIREKEGMMGASSEVSSVVARTEADLRKLTDGIPRDQYDVLFKSNTKDWFKAKDAYDYQLTVHEPRVNSNLQKSGVLGSYFPETLGENVIEDYIRHIQHQEANIIRRSIETKYAQPFAELRSMGKQFEEIATSKAQADVKRFKSQVENPFEEIIKLALDVSKRSEYTLLHEANEFTESLGKSAYRMFAVNKDKALSKMISWEEANAMSEKFGIRGPYTNAEEYFVANRPAEKSITKEFVARANMMMVNFTLRLDMAQSLINAISTPILYGTEMASIRNLVATDSELAGKLRELRTIKVPGEDFGVPSSMKLMARAIGNFFSADKAQLLTRYKELAIIRDNLSKYHEMLDHFSIKPWQAVSKYKEAGDKAIEIGAKFSGNIWAEEFTRFISADVMRQLTDPIVAAGKMSVAEQNAYMTIFVNRVQGNYISSQRPIAFQGVLGSAVSLFQTYQFNLLQQLFRHVENADKRAVFTMMGMQGGLYGANGIPFFEGVNNYLIGQSSLNPQHKDIYSTAATTSAALTGNRELGEWLMYGTASAFPFWSSRAPALYTRGDINPRHVTILPIVPTDIVAVDGSIRVVKNLWDFGKKIMAGADMSETFMEAIEHNGINRPLAGMAQLATGRATTSKGGLIAASNDFFSIATLTRLIGAKPMDESLALNTYFRLHGYQAADQQRLEDLGEVVKTKLRKNQLPTTDELRKFQLEYVSRGGRIENYSKAVQRWSTDANTSIVNKLIRQHQSSYSKRMIEIMGGVTLPDYRSAITIASDLAQEEPSQGQ